MTTRRREADAKRDGETNERAGTIPITIDAFDRIGEAWAGWVTFAIDNGARACHGADLCIRIGGHEGPHLTSFGRVLKGRPARSKKEAKP